MRKFLLATAALVLGVGSTDALMIAIRPAPQRAITAEAVVVGKVTAIEKDTVEAVPPFPGAKEKVTYRVAVVKIESMLAGADNLTHIKIGTQPPQPAPVPAPPGGPGVRPIRPIRPGFQVPELKEGQEMLFFLTKHPSADFYIIPNMSLPVDIKTDAGKKELEAVKKVTGVLADPMKALKSDKAETRLLAATTMVTKYRSYPDFGGEVEQAAIPADESKLILKALVEADWSNKVRPAPGADVFANPINAFYQLGLSEQDGWAQPAFPRPQPGQPPVDFNALTKEAFVKWLDGPGKDYRVKKLVPKK
ncbi:hypothetical protein R5W23_001021 [Gemmata sp. JC673]|uniref:Uncharacterized protein n=1 Tax=Gemmata algarum TaxID=2975278 RepID=A0ABU5EY24_9BACT|nr:hypothetical protein [Gemmata algarum]MDY3559849.1 hypothetical protein [Gemmata algarum]